MWMIRDAQVLDTGFDPKLSLADPDFDKHLGEHIHHIYEMLLSQCSCGDCKKVQRTTLKEWEAGLKKPQE